MTNQGRMTERCSNVHGWVGVLDQGSRAKAGFSLLHADRVVRGWPDSWRSASLYGQVQESHEPVNQRLKGEIHLNELDVNHTKNDILWVEDEDEQVEEKLLEACADYREFASRRRRGDKDGGRSDIDVQTAVEELEVKLNSEDDGFDFSRKYLTSRGRRATLNVLVSQWTARASLSVS